MAHQSLGFPSSGDDRSGLPESLRESPDSIKTEKDGIVDRKSALHAWMDNDGRYRTLFDLAPVAVYCCDAWGVIREYNKRAAELWGRTPLLGDTDERFCGSFKLYRPDGSFMPHEQCPMGDVLTGKEGGIHDAEVNIERPDGSRVMVIVNIAPLTDDQGEITGAINCFYDVTERKRAEEALLNSDIERGRMEEALRESETRLRMANEKLESDVQRRTDALRDLSARLLRVQDEERRRIARDLHDCLGQYLACVKMNLDMLKPSAATNQGELLSAALESVERSIAETRTLSFLLHPPLLDEAGFASAARWFTEGFAKRSGIAVKLDLPDDLARLPELAETALFRILQESLTNVHRHSGSSQVHVELTRETARIMLTVKDFGSGISAENLDAFRLKGTNCGVGLAGMRERVNDLGGHFELTSGKDGTTVFVSFPLPSDDDSQGVTIGHGGAHERFASPLV